MGIKKFFKKLKESKVFKGIMNVAPTVAGALGGPFGFLAVNTINEVLGTAYTDEEQFAQAVQADPNIMLKMKEVESAFLLKMDENDLSREDLHAQDRQSAREMHVALKDKTPFILAVYILSLFTALAGTILWGIISANLVIDPTIEKFLYFLFGAVTGWVTQVISFHFGSSKGSQLKSIENAEALRNYMGR